MKLHLVFLLSALLWLPLSCKKDDSPTPQAPPDSENQEPEDPTTNPDSSTATLLSVSGKQILGEDGTPIQLQGIVFNNWHWIEDPLPPTTHHSEIDYTRVSDMGMNVVRFHLNYHIFEDDSSPYQYKQTAWDWIDQNISWAKNNDVYLILNMHSPQGGYQSQGTGDELWDNVENQNRLTALWKAIAERYKDETQIAGYGVLNEPIPNQSITQWSELAQRLVNEIRAADDNHIVFLEQAISVKGQAEPDPELNFPRVSGLNIVYEFHTYEPFLFTHQLLAFSGVGEGGNYPDEELLEIGDATWHTAIFNNPVLTGDSDWQFFEGERFLIDDSNIKIGVPTLITGNIGALGRIDFDDIVVNEYGPDGMLVRSISPEKMSSEAGWAYWSRDESGNGGANLTEGRNDNFSFFISGATDESNLSNRFASFIPLQGYSYSISGWMKGQNIAAGGDALLRLDFYTTEGDVHVRNRAYLASILDRVLAWADKKNAPIYIGEVGTGGPSFENSKGGFLWVQDMISLSLEKRIHFTYFDYHNSNFGIYFGENGLPDPNNARQVLIDWFAQNLN